MDPLKIADELNLELAPLKFSKPVTHVYNPLVYARRPYQQYLRRYGAAPKEILLVGMNPGPWGMAQTGIPFGEVGLVRDWLGISEAVGKPEGGENPKRPILGFDCKRSEVSGSRLWGWARQTFLTPERFFSRFLIINYCPLVFMEAGGKNLTPDKLATAEREPLIAACDRALRRTAEHYRPMIVIGVGQWAQTRAREALAGLDLRIGGLLHPSPANPQANKGWAKAAEASLRAQGISF